MDVQPADPTQRRRVIRILIAVAILLLGLLAVFELWLQRVSAELDPARLIALIKPILFACMLLSGACFVALGAHLAIRGGRIVRDRRYPARDTRVVRATPIREGVEAVWIGQACRLAGFAAGLLGCLVAVCGMFWVRGIG